MSTSEERRSLFQAIKDERASVSGAAQASPCEQDCTIKEWPHDGPCEVQEFFDAPGCQNIHGSDAAVAVGRFAVDGPSGYRSRLGGPLRATRAAAEADFCATSCQPVIPAKNDATR